jgi:hypothetical protein
MTVAGLDRGAAMCWKAVLVGELAVVDELQAPKSSSSSQAWRSPAKHCSSWLTALVSADG